MGTTTTVLTNSWQEVATGPALIAIEEGAIIWLNIGSTMPTDDENRLSLYSGKDRSYLSQQFSLKTFAKISTSAYGTPTRITVIEA